MATYGNTSSSTWVGYADGKTPEKEQHAVLSRQVSVSEAAEKSGVTIKAPVYIRWLEYPFRVKDPVEGITLPEATGWGMDSAGRGPLNQVGSYIGTAILRLAKDEAKALGKSKVYGFKPSSLLTLFTSVIGIIAALMMPVVGAVVDHTQYRRLMGVISGVLSVAFIGGQIAISADNWFSMLIIDACQTLVFLVHTTSVFAYLPDLSLDQEVIAHYTSAFNIRQYCGQFVYVAFVIICGQARGDAGTPTDNSVQTAKDAAGLAFGWGALFIGYAWMYLFRDRPALSKVPEDSTLITTGFKQVGKTARVILKNYHGLKWFMISLLWSPEAGAGVVLSIAVTFLTVRIDLDGLEIAKTSLILMVGNLAGSLFSKKVCALINPLNSYRVGLTVLGITIACSTIYLDAPRKLTEVYLTAVAWGFSMGWTYPSQRVLFCTLIPKGQETEMMGLFVFVGQILGWLPSLIFTIMNENDVPLEWGLALIGGFCAMAVVCTLPMGSYEKACEEAALASRGKLTAVVEATAHHRPVTESDNMKDVSDDELVALEEDKKTEATNKSVEDSGDSAPNKSDDEGEEANASKENP
mmetsp:Transcript_18236/g.34614  ORF Transcript_18236/g.34614 Transcript_18236/m.34614 type:complete len:580 (+) Transcript_18236:200-1939(+)|eukprot:scaffold2536_cov169-Amphora_coffeaeformis.AAC.26